MQNAKLKIILLAILFLGGFALAEDSKAATLRLQENFDDQAIDSRLTTRIYGVWDITPPTFSWGAGRGGSGYSYGSGTNPEAFLEWNNIGTWHTDDLYISWWMNYPTFVHHWSNENIKFFYPSFGTGGTDKVEYVLYNGTNSGMFSGYVNGAWMSPTGWLTLANQADGNWHRYEFYFKFSTGIHKFWYDRPVGAYTDSPYLKVDRNYGAGAYEPTISYLTFMSMNDDHGGTEISEFTRFIDDIEVWDGMPDEEPGDTIVPASPSGLAVS